MPKEDLVIGEGGSGEEKCATVAEEPIVMEEDAWGWKILWW